MICWLKQNIYFYDDKIRYSGIFGSFNYKDYGFGDIDLIFVCDHHPDSGEWHSLRSSTKHLKTAFEKYFSVNLSIVILNYKEWLELENFFIPRETILNNLFINR